MTTESNCPVLSPHSERKRAAIVAAAMQEFRSNGFAATSMDKIAASANVSKRTVYNHFPSKEDLFAAILLALWQNAVAELDLRYQPQQALEPQLLSFMQRKMQMLCDPNFIDLARVAIASTLHQPERAQGMLEKMKEKEEGIYTWIRAAQADGRLRHADPVFMGDMLQGQLKALAFWPQVALGKPILGQVEQEELVRATVAMFVKFYVL